MEGNAAQTRDAVAALPRAVSRDWLRFGRVPPPPIDAGPDHSEGDTVGKDLAAPATPSTAVDRGKRRKTLEASWVVGVVVFVVVRFVVAYSALVEYDRLTVVIFGLLDLGTAVPYAVGTARLVTSLVDGEVEIAARWGAVAAFCFLAPYLWIAWAGRDGEFPTIVYVVTAVLAVCLGVNAVFGLRRRVRDERRRASAA